MKRQLISGCLVTVVCLALGTTGAAQSSPNSFAIARLYIEFNQSGNDLGFHVFLDGEDWKALKIQSPSGRTIFEGTGRGPYADLGLTEFFFEGAEPSLDDVPLADLLARFPEGTYKFIGVTVDGASLTNRVTLSHAIPDGPRVSSAVDGNEVVIRWDPVSAPPPGFPDRKIKIVGYQVIVGSFQVTLPASSPSVEVPEEFIATLGPGAQQFEVLAIDASGNQTITEGEFELE
jgi:hypothetical protein